MMRYIKLNIIIIIMFMCFLPVKKIYAFDNSNIVSVRDYGAKGDGVTNDLEAINSAINSCSSNTECTIYFPTGQYLINGSITISKSNIRLLGDNNTRIFFPSNITLEDTSQKIKVIGVIVVKTINQDINNVVIENLIIDANASNTKYGKQDSLGRGITFIRQGKYPGTKDYYEMSNIKIKNCTIQNSYSYGIAIVGGQQPKSGYTDAEISNLNKTSEEDFDLRNYYNYYDIENVEIDECKVSKSRIGIRLNRVKNATISNTEVIDSRFENITLQVEKGLIENNKTFRHFGGCGSICLDRSENLKIINNTIDDSETNTSDINKSGICQNSSAGPSYNIFISNNNINNSARGIWIKNHLKSANPHNKNDGGSRPGAGFIIKDNIITKSTITDIRIDELLNTKVTSGEYVGKSYLYNKYNNTLNLEAYNNSQVGSNMKTENNKYLEIVKPTQIMIAKVDQNDNFISGSKLQILDENENGIGTYESTDSLIEIDLLLGNYILKDLENGKTISFSVENNNYQRKYIYIIEENKSENDENTSDDKDNKENSSDNKTDLENDKSNNTNKIIDDEQSEDNSENNEELIDNNDNNSSIIDNQKDHDSINSENRSDEKENNINNSPIKKGIIMISVIFAIIAIILLIITKNKQKNK